MLDVLGYLFFSFAIIFITVVMMLAIIYFQYQKKYGNK